MDIRPSNERRKRSHSPSTSQHHHDSSKRRRHRHHHSSSSSHSHTHPSNTSTPKPNPKPLPSGAPFISHYASPSEFHRYRPLFAQYLDVQKGLGIDELEEREVKGRWKRFVRVWNEAGLSRGWYELWGSVVRDGVGMGGDGRERETGKRGEQKLGGGGSKGTGERGLRSEGKGSRAMDKDVRGRGGESSDESEDEFGPAPLDASQMQAKRRVGPSIPSFDELRERQDLLLDDRRGERNDLRHDRTLDREIQKERLDELVPKAEAGSRERMLEKKREKADLNREFKAAREGGGMEEVGDGELMGGDDGIDGFKKQLKEKERAKNEREIRREEVLRARAAEREERMKKFREKEEKTMSALKEIARQRFGSG